MYYETKIGDSSVIRRLQYLVFGFLLTAIAGCGAESFPLNPAAEDGIPPDVRPKANPEVFTALSRGETRDLLVVLNANLIERQAIASGEPPLPDEPYARMQRSSVLYDRALDEMASLLSSTGLLLLRRFSPIPVFFIRTDSLPAVIALLRDPRIIGVDEDQRVPLALAESLPMIGQDRVIASGHGGRGASVVVMDTGIEPRFANRLTPVDFPDNDAFLDDCYDLGHRGACHGTNVSAIVSGVAPDANIIALDVFDGWDADGEASTHWGTIVGAYQWMLQEIKENQNRFNIVAVNLSLGSTLDNCPGTVNDCQPGSHNCTHALRVAIAEALRFNVLTVAAAGNDCYANRLGFPACIPEVISVGAVYDGRFGSQPPARCPAPANECVDQTTALDQVTCFSNSSEALTLLAPGALIRAGRIERRLVSPMTDPRIFVNNEIQLRGTSQAAPHVAGAVAVLRAAYPWMQPSEIRDCLRKTGIPIRDPRNGFVVPRLNLLAAVSECYAPCYARCCQGTDAGSLMGPHFFDSVAECKAWGEQVCQQNGGTIRIEYNKQDVLGISKSCGEPCYVRCCDEQLVGPKYFKDAVSCGNWRQSACIGHGGPARAEYMGSLVPPDQTSQCSQSCEYLCCDGYTPPITQIGDVTTCVDSGRKACDVDDHGGAVSVNYGGIKAWVGNGTCSGKCSASCCNGTSESMRTTNPQSCITANLCAGADTGGAKRTVFKPDRAVHEGFPVKHDVACKQCDVVCCDSSKRQSTAISSERCGNVSSSICGPVGSSDNVRFADNLVSGINSTCVEAYSRCCQPDAMSSPYGHLAGPNYFESANAAEMGASAMCMMWKGPIRLQVEERYRTGISPACGSPAYAICQSGREVGPIWYIDCKTDLAAEFKLLKQECESEGGLEKIRFAGMIVWDANGTNLCP